MEIKTYTKTLFALIFLFLFINVVGAQTKIRYSVSKISTSDTLRLPDVYLNISSKDWLHPLDRQPIKDSKKITWSSYIGNDTIREMTGIKMNKEEIFLHPIRMFQYKILEFNPFPIVKFPLEVGKKWKWNLEHINMIYVDAIKDAKIRDKIKGPKIDLQSSYIVNQKGINEGSDFYEIVATSQSFLGTTRSRYYYSEKQGFFFMEFHTLNNEIFVFKREKNTFIHQEKRVHFDIIKPYDYNNNH